MTSLCHISYGNNCTKCTTQPTEHANSHPAQQPSAGVPTSIFPPQDFVPLGPPASELKLPPTGDSQPLSSRQTLQPQRVSGAVDASFERKFHFINRVSQQIPPEARGRIFRLYQEHRHSPDSSALERHVHSILQEHLQPSFLQHAADTYQTCAGEQQRTTCLSSPSLSDSSLIDLSHFLSNNPLTAPIMRHQPAPQSSKSAALDKDLLQKQEQMESHEVSPPSCETCCMATSTPVRVSGECHRIGLSDNVFTNPTESVDALREYLHAEAALYEQEEIMLQQQQPFQSVADRPRASLDSGIGGMLHSLSVTTSSSNSNMLLCGDTVGNTRQHYTHILSTDSCCNSLASLDFSAPTTVMDLDDTTSSSTVCTFPATISSGLGHDVGGYLQSSSSVEAAMNCPGGSCEACCGDDLSMALPVDALEDVDMGEMLDDNQWTLPSPSLLPHPYEVPTPNSTQLFSNVIISPMGTPAWTTEVVAFPVTFPSDSVSLRRHSDPEHTVRLLLPQTGTSTYFLESATSSNSATLWNLAPSIDLFRNACDGAGVSAPAAVGNCAIAQSKKRRKSLTYQTQEQQQQQQQPRGRSSTLHASHPHSATCSHAKSTGLHRVRSEKAVSILEKLLDT